MATKRQLRREEVRKKFGKLIDLLYAESKKKSTFTHTFTKPKTNGKICNYCGADKSSNHLSR